MDRAAPKQSDALFIPWAIVKDKLVPNLSLVEMVRQQHRLLDEIERLRGQAIRAATVETTLDGG